MRRNFYEAFTLVEMLIVMGILIILMAIGITAGRFAINRANDVAHQNAVDQIYQGLQAYYTDERAFPAQQTPSALITVLDEYMDEGVFKGGTESTFIYIVEPTHLQSVLVCVSLRGQATDNNSRTDGGYYCNGNGFGDDEMPLTITNKNFENGATPDADFTTLVAYYTSNSATIASDWDGNVWQ